MNGYIKKQNKDYNHYLNTHKTDLFLLCAYMFALEAPNINRLLDSYNFMFSCTLSVRIKMVQYDHFHKNMWSKNNMYGCDLGLSQEDLHRVIPRIKAINGIT